MCVLLRARAAIYKKRFSGSSVGFPKAFTFFHLWSHSTLLYEADAVQKHLSKFEKERLNVWGKNCSIVPPLCADEVGAVPEEGVTLLVPQEGAKGRGQVIVHVPWDNPSTQKNFIVSFFHKICQYMFRSHYCAFPFGFCYFIQSAGDLPILDHVVKVSAGILLGCYSMLLVRGNLPKDWKWKASMNDSFELHRPSFSLSTERVFFISSTENALVVVVWRGGCNHVAQIKGSRLLCGAVGGRIKWRQPTTSVQVFQV